MIPPTLITSIQSITHDDQRVYCMIVYAGTRPGNVPLTATDTRFLIKLSNRYPFAPNIRYEHHASPDSSPPSTSEDPINIILWHDPSSEDQLKQHAAHIASWRTRRDNLQAHIGLINNTLHPAAREPSTTDQIPPAAVDPASQNAKPWGAPPTSPPWATTTPRPNTPDPQPKQPPEQQPEPINFTTPNWVRKTFSKSLFLTTAAAFATGIICYVVYRIAT